MYQWRVSIPHLIYAPRGCAGIRIGSMSAMQTRIPRQDSRASLEDEYLGFHHEITTDVIIPEPKLEDKPPCGRVNLTEREAGERICDFDGIENCMTKNEACQEASRCLRCDHFGYGIFKGGGDTKW